MTKAFGQSYRLRGDSHVAINSFAGLASLAQGFMKFAQGSRALKQGKKVQLLVWFDLDSTGVMVRGKMFFK